jgi:hypothetical protein
MKEIKLTIKELELMYEIPPKQPEQETDYQRHHRMGRNSLINELIEKINTKQK